MNIKLKDSVKGKKQVVFEKKPALYAQKCDECGAVFKMDKYCNDALSPGVISGTFDKIVNGNRFTATICSLACADKIFTGGWKKLKEYKDFKKVGAELVRVEIGITSLIKNEQELIDEWAAR